MGSCRGLTSGIVFCLVVRGSVPRMSGSRGCTKCLTATVLASSPGLDVDEEGPDLIRDDDGLKQEGAGWVESS